MAKEETNVSKGAQVEASENNCRLFRNNRGMFYTMSGQKTRAGLETDGASDLIGFAQIIVTPELVGKKLAVLLVVECKKPSWKKVSTAIEIAQEKFINFVRNWGGMGFFLNNPKDFKSSLDKSIKMLSK